MYVLESIKDKVLIAQLCFDISVCASLRFSRSAFWSTLWRFEVRFVTSSGVLECVSLPAPAFWSAIRGINFFWVRSDLRSNVLEGVLLLKWLPLHNINYQANFLVVV